MRMGSSISPTAGRIHSEASTDGVYSRLLAPTMALCRPSIASVKTRYSFERIPMQEMQEMRKLHTISVRVCSFS